MFWSDCLCFLIKISRSEDKLVLLVLFFSLCSCCYHGKSRLKWTWTLQQPKQIRKKQQHLDVEETCLSTSNRNTNILAQKQKLVVTLRWFTHWWVDVCPASQNSIKGSICEELQLIGAKRQWEKEKNKKKTHIIAPSPVSCHISPSVLVFMFQLPPRLLKAISSLLCFSCSVNIISHCLVSSVILKFRIKRCCRNRHCVFCIGSFKEDDKLRNCSSLVTVIYQETSLPNTEEMYVNI